MEIKEGDDCKGCSFGEHDHQIQCRIKNQGMDYQCPCLRCILKSCCTCYCPAWANLAKSVGVGLVVEK